MINLSLGGVRDPVHPRLDAYSRAEADAVAYAVAHHVVVVAAVGNGDQSPREPWHFASYPAALPHVIGVSAFTQDGSVPDFSNRDAIYNDITAPGEGILSTLPLKLTAQFPTCPDQGYSDCGSEDYRAAEGTSFAAPQVTAAAAMLLSVDPALTPDQVTTILERTATDANASNGCQLCPLGRDAYTGWGRLNVAAALAALTGTIPKPDSLEPNDDAGAAAWPLSGGSGTVHATVDFWDDQSDVYRILLRKGQRLFAVLSGPKGTDTVLTLWKPETDARGRPALPGPAHPALGSRRLRREDLVPRAVGTGLYFLHVKIEAERRGPVHAAVLEDAAGLGGHLDVALDGRLRVEELVCRDVAQDAGRVADDDDAGRDVLRHNCARADERVLADHDLRAQHGAAADPGAAADRRPLDVSDPLVRATHPVVVGGDDARGDEDVLLERRVRGDVRVRLDLRHGADRRVVLDERASPDDDVVADRHPLSHTGLVAEDDAMPHVVPANTMAPVETIEPSPIMVGASGSRLAVERGESVGCFPTTAPSSTLTPSPSTVPG